MFMTVSCWSIIFKGLKSFQWFTQERKGFINKIMYLKLIFFCHRTMTRQDYSMTNQQMYKRINTKVTIHLSIYIQPRIRKIPVLEGNVYFSIKVLICVMSFQTAFVKNSFLVFSFCRYSFRVFFYDLALSRWHFGNTFCAVLTLLMFIKVIVNVDLIISICISYSTQNGHMIY